jgi:4-amino-4-deoxy-L-arabinose transferase-like glycosyltransferase
MHFVSEVPYGLYLVLACASTLRQLKSGSEWKRWLWLAGVSWALAVVTRPQLAFALPLVGVAVIVLWSQRQRVVATRLGAMMLLVIALVMPWVVRNSMVVGRPTIAGVGAYTFWGAHNDRVLADPALRGFWVRTSDLVDRDHPLMGSEVERDAQAWRYGIEFVRSNLKSMPMLEAMKIRRMLSPFENTSNRTVFWAFAVGWMGIAPFVAFGFVLAFREDRTVAWVLATPLVATFLCALVFYGSARFRDSASPVLAVVAAAGIVGALNAADRWTRG